MGASFVFAGTTDGFLDRTHTFAFPRRGCARAMLASSPQENRGRRECRALVAPAASHANESEHTSLVTTVTPETPGIPRAMVLQLIPRSPR